MSNKSDLGKLFPAIGYVIIQWSFIEMRLDMCIASLYQDKRSRSIYKTVPKKLKEKTKFLRQAINVFSFPEDLAKKCDSALGKIANMKDYRHAFAHSVPASDKSNNGVFLFTSLRSDDNFHYQETWEFNINTFPKQRQKLQELVDDMEVVAHLVIEFSDTLEQ